MKLYLLSQSVNNDYDTYDSVVVCAENENEARVVNPGGFYKWHDNAWWFQYWDKTERKQNDDTWCLPSEVEIVELGEAKEDLKAGVVCASYNAA